MYCGIHIKTIWQPVPKLLLYTMSLKITLSKLLPHLPEANESICLQVSVPHHGVCRYVCTWCCYSINRHSAGYKVTHEKRNWPPWLLTVSSRWPKWSQPAVTELWPGPWLSCDLAVTEPWSYWRCRDWAVTSPWLSCDLAVTELWPRRDWAVTSPWLSCDLSSPWLSRDHWARSRDHRGHRELTVTIFSHG